MTAEFAGASQAYKWGSTVDASAVAQATALLRGGFAGTDCRNPTFFWVNTSLTDAASHEAGPHSEMARAAVGDTDARVGEILAVARENLDFSKTTVFVLADHGMEMNDPDITGDWGDALRDAGLNFRDEASGFLYFGCGS
jgi:phosphonoacetate hydrolase